MGTYVYRNLKVDKVIFTTNSMVLGQAWVGKKTFKRDNVNTVQY